MTVTVKDAAKASSPPIPVLERPVYAVAKALTYLCLASMWVGGTAATAVAFTDLASPGGAYGMGYPVFRALLKLSTDATLFGVLLALVALLLLLHAALRLCNVPPPRGRAHLHLAAFLRHRLPSQTNTSLFCVLCPHSCAPGKNFPVGHPSLQAKHA
jgi:hypothetical protein